MKPIRKGELTADATAAPWVLADAVSRCWIISINAAESITLPNV